MNASIQRLRAEVASDLAAFNGRVAELARMAPFASAGPAHLAYAAVALHHGYGAFEAALARVVRVLDGELPGGRDWHQSLLHVATLDIEGVRPALVSTATVARLRQLLGFRHFFRHGYGVELDALRLEELRRVALEAQQLVNDDFEKLDELLKSLAQIT